MKLLEKIAAFFSSIQNFFKNAQPFFTVAFAVLALSAAVAGSAFRVFEIYELRTYDWRFQLKPRPPVSDKIVMIDIWDDSLQKIGSWPFDRAYHAQIVEALRVYGARMVGMDILFAEDRSGDDALEAAARAYGNVYFSEVLNLPHSEAGGRVTSKGYLTPLLERFRAVAKGVGHVNALVDRDGTRRRTIPLIEVGGKPAPQLALLMAADYLGIPTSQIRADGHGHVKVGDKISIPLDDNGYMLIDYAGTWAKTFTHYSYADLLISFEQMQNGEKPLVDLNILKDKVCFLGMTATASHDINAIPLEPSYPQVGSHANVFNNILNGRFVVRVSVWWNIFVLALLCVLALALTRIPRLMLSLTAAATSLAMFITFNCLLFWYALWWIDLFYPAIAFGVIYLYGILRRTMSEKRKREFIEAELSIASNIQKSFLPSHVPETPTLDISFFMKPAKQVGGDLYAIFRVGESHIGTMLGDVSGKGTPAALFMAKSVSEFKYNSRGSEDPSLVLAHMNDSLASDESSGLFVTVTYVIFMPEQKRALISNGGHLPVLKVSQAGTSELLMPEGGMPISLMPGVEFSNLETGVAPGDIFLLYSDGISESKNTKREDYEMDRLTAAVKHVRHLSAKEIQNAVLKDIEKFVGTAPQHDDMTLIVIKVKDPVA